MDALTDLLGLRSLGDPSGFGLSNTNAPRTAMYDFGRHRHRTAQTVAASLVLRNRPSKPSKPTGFIQSNPCFTNAAAITNDLLTSCGPLEKATEIKEQSKGRYRMVDLKSTRRSLSTDIDITEPEFSLFLTLGSYIESLLWRHGIEDIWCERQNHPVGLLDADYARSDDRKRSDSCSGEQPTLDPRRSNPS